jgi:hypothetical protein
MAKVELKSWRKTQAGSRMTMAEAKKKSLSMTSA